MCAWLVVNCCVADHLFASCCPCPARLQVRPVLGGSKAELQGAWKEWLMQHGGCCTRMHAVIWVRCTYACMRAAYACMQSSGCAAHTHACGHLGAMHIRMHGCCMCVHAVIWVRCTYACMRVAYACMQPSGSGAQGCCACACACTCALILMWYHHACRAVGMAVMLKIH